MRTQFSRFSLGPVCVQVMWIDASDLEETHKERGGEYLEKYETAWQTLKSADVSRAPLS